MHPATDGFPDAPSPYYVKWSDWQAHFWNSRASLPIRTFSCLPPHDWQQISFLENPKMQRSWTIFWRDHYILLIFFFTFCHLSIFGNQRRYSSRLINPMFIYTPCIVLYKFVPFYQNAKTFVSKFFFHFNWIWVIQKTR